MMSATQEETTMNIRKDVSFESVREFRGQRRVHRD